MLIESATDSATPPVGDPPPPPDMVPLRLQDIQSVGSGQESHTCTYPIPHHMRARTHTHAQHNRCAGNEEGKNLKEIKQNTVLSAASDQIWLRLYTKICTHSSAPQSRSLGLIGQPQRINNVVVNNLIRDSPFHFRFCMPKLW